jgi:hypothetical protein
VTVTGYMTWLIFMAPATAVILVVGTLAAANVIHGRDNRQLRGPRSRGIHPSHGTTGQIADEERR